MSDIRVTGELLRAETNIDILRLEAGVLGTSTCVRRPDLDDGRFAFHLSDGVRNVSVWMPGLDLEHVRTTGAFSPKIGVGETLLDWREVVAQVRKLGRS